MDAVELERTADSLAAVIAELDAGDLDASKQGRAYLEGAEPPPSLPAPPLGL